MAYKDRFVVVIIQDNQIQKELANGSVPIKFGEYKIRLRNKNNKRAICKLFIDGENVSDGGFIIPPNSFIDIERPASVSKKFKFVSLDSQEAYDFGKNGENFDKKKGTIVAKFVLEKQNQYLEDIVKINKTRKTYYIPVGSPPPKSNTWFVEPRSWMFGTSPETINEHVSSMTADFIKTTNATSYTSLNALNQTAPATDWFRLDWLQDGATVEGSNSNQKFNTVYFEHDDNWTEIKLFLQGYESSLKNSEQESVQIDKENLIDENDEFIELINDINTMKKELEQLKTLKKLKEEQEKIKKEIVSVREKLGIN